VASEPPIEWNRLLGWVAAVEELRESVRPNL
jgi:hypothetical protein